MYRCCNCGRIFDEPVEQYEESEFWGIPKKTSYYVSPCCNEGFDEYDDEEEGELIAV